MTIIAGISSPLHESNPKVSARWSDDDKIIRRDAARLQDSGSFERGESGRENSIALGHAQVARNPWSENTARPRGPSRPAVRRQREPAHRQMSRN